MTFDQILLGEAGCCSSTSRSKLSTCFDSMGSRRVGRPDDRSGKDFLSLCTGESTSVNYFFFAPRGFNVTITTNAKPWSGTSWYVKTFTMLIERVGFSYQTESRMWTSRIVDIQGTVWPISVAPVRIVDTVNTDWFPRVTPAGDPEVVDAVDFVSDRFFIASEGTVCLAMSLGKDEDLISFTVSKMDEVDHLRCWCTLVCEINCDFKNSTMQYIRLPERS